MATTNRERVGRTLELLQAALEPFVEKKFQARYGGSWRDEIAQVLGREHDWTTRDGETHLDAQALLSLMVNRWNEVFSSVLGQAERSHAGELRDVRNRWAHQQSFTADDAYRALDTVHRLLTAIAAPEAEEVDKERQDLLRVRFEEQTRRESRRVAATAVEGQTPAGLKPWRDVITPHHDVASGRYVQAEFAADLWQVYRSQFQRGAASDEYADPREFFPRTYLPQSLRQHLVGAVRRLGSNRGDPVVELQTNFGGGKTHSMLALYHLFSGHPASDLAGIDTVLREADAPLPTKTHRAVLVGTALSPAQPHRKPDGTVIHTLWGELAYQLGGADGYGLVAEADRRGISPGSDALRELFEFFSPALVLIDEWVAYVRMLYGVSDLPAGSFDATLTFAQALTEAARQAPRTLVVASIPASDIEIGGEGGQAALVRLKNTFGRLESAWRPASAEEGYEIVRRRLFLPIADPQAFIARDTVVRAFAQLYQSQATEFPTACREAEYERRLRDAYPIHPELFDRLYQDWSSLDKFQRTRGVLRLMAAVIHTLWQRGDRGLLIMPSTVPIDEPSVQWELTRYLEDPWVPVIEKDVDGPNSLPLKLDQENPNLGRYSASRRVTRTLYLGSAPTAKTSNRGLEDRGIKLGCAQPGESVATFGDALRRLTDHATHLYVDGRRYWFATQPSVARLAQDRAGQQDPDVVDEEIRKRVRQAASQRGDFVRVHACPTSSADVPDEAEARLVILGPDDSHASRDRASAGLGEAKAILEQRGSGPRLYKNMLVFLAPDRTRLAELQQAMRQYLAWKSIEDERETLNLDAFQSNQAKSKREQADETVGQRIKETWVWLLVPSQSEPLGEVEWDEQRLQGDDPLAVRTSRKLRNMMLLVAEYGYSLLRAKLDEIPLWRGDHVAVKQLWDDYARYLYLERLRDGDVLLNAIRQGVATLTWAADGFAYAERWDEPQKRYRGLRMGETGSVALTEHSVVVKPEVACRQREAAEEEPRQAQEVKPAAAYPEDGDGRGSGQGLKEPAVATGDGGGGRSVVTPLPRKPRRFHGSVPINALRPERDAGVITREVIQRLTALANANVEITLEISAEIPDGAPEHVVRTVNENCRTLKFQSYGFEES
ncbi:MAG: ATP-binding protein [Chloroflexi bacterium]|nr:ATP-binding protein [Chloroflexota bacterium]